ncbi:MAG: hypothetical protein NC078_10915 [Ruminococcus sp.]|nr:hypothetical protein [Ruminococcus sp.]
MNTPRPKTCNAVPALSLSGLYALMAVLSGIVGKGDMTASFFIFSISAAYLLEAVRMIRINLAIAEQRKRCKKNVQQHKPRNIRRSPAAASESSCA